MGNSQKSGPRVRITYPDEASGSKEHRELPFVVGVLADLSGTPKEAMRPLKERKWLTIDRATFDEVIARATPRLSIQVEDKITGKSQKLAVELIFRRLKDFEPAGIAQQVPALQEMVEMRKHLCKLLDKTREHPDFKCLLNDVLANTERAMALAEELGVSSKANSDIN